MELVTLRDLYWLGLKDLWSAGRQVVSALPGMAERVSDPGLRQTLAHQHTVTENQMVRLEQILGKAGCPLSGAECLGARGILSDTERLYHLDSAREAFDAALLAAAQRLAYYQLAAYRCARTYARLLGEDWATQLLDQCVEEESDFDHHLSALAERVINVRAR